jgi:hypothetical protein
VERRPRQPLARLPSVSRPSCVPFYNQIFRVCQQAPRLALPASNNDEGVCDCCHAGANPLAAIATGMRLRCAIAPSAPRRYPWC